MTSQTLYKDPQEAVLLVGGRSLFLSVALEPRNPINYKKTSSGAPVNVKAASLELGYL